MKFPTVPCPRLWLPGVLALGLTLPAGFADAQWVRGSEQFYLPAQHNWVFRHNYIGSDRLFNAFDYGHAILYETLYRYPEGPVERLEEKEFEFVSERLLKRPPRVALEERAVEIAYARLVPEAKLMFEWAHVFHRQVYDILADERLTQPEKDAEVAELLAYYRSRPDLAFSSVPKSMDIMDGQPYSLAFRESFPKFNGLIWAYHWLQVGLYEPLLVNNDVASRTAGVTATVGRFWQMLENPPVTMPHLMPMTAGIAPAFAQRYPEAAVIFDNLHMMHDVISDVLAAPEVPRNRKRAEILRAAEMFRDDTSYAISMEEWAMMGESMGIHNMGGRAVGFTAELPRPTVPMGMSMAGMDHSAHDPVDAAGADPAEHAGHAMPDSAVPGGGMTSEEHMRTMHEMHVRMMADPQIQQRVAADSALQRMMAEMQSAMMSGQPADQSAGASGSDVDLVGAFILRLLADPGIEGRIHADPTLHQLWSDPALQEELRRMRESRDPDPSDRPPAAQPARGAPTPAHQHR
ncbi:MAG TPA: hypothetical protein VMN39_01600 [Longimicrobiaceae bacterium]|nr:hypothetical protein [Longimicrobiaceae bacterium]